MKTLRSLQSPAENILKEKMVFIGGPRQVGKTTLGKTILEKFSSSQYLNWDSTEDRSAILKNKILEDSKIIFFDEIHKYKLWRGLLKGLYDKHKDKLSILVTGSARLDYFRKGGDSLLGRYRYLRLHPFSLLELNANPTQKDLESLLKFGGFPSPLFKQSESELRLWHKERNYRIINQDLRDLENIKEISLVELLAENLPDRVGSPLSIKSISEDLSTAPQSVDRWISMLERLYFVYRIPPFGSPKIRAVKKEQKIYFWDWSVIENSGARFENLVASHLLKFCHKKEDLEGYTMELRFIRDTDKREIDFVVLQNKKPLFAVECKTGERSLSPHIRYFQERTKIPKFYQVHMGKADFGSSTTGRVIPFAEFCKLEMIP